MTILRHLGTWAATLSLLVVALPEASLAQRYDDLSCYPVRVRGNQWLVEAGHAGEVLTLVPSLAPFPIDEGCRLLRPRKLRPREVCLPSDVQPSGAPDGGELQQVYACYSIRCAAGAGFQLSFATQFGSGERYVLREGGVRTLCVPTQVGGGATPTPTAVATPVVTATPTATPAVTATPTATPAVTATPTAAPTPSGTATPLPTATPTTSATPTSAVTPTPAQASPTPVQTATPPPTPSPVPCGVGSQCVFVSSVAYTASQVGGAAGANAKCQALAEAAGLPGTYDAWLSTTISSPATALPQPATPYRRLDGVTVATSWADLTDGSLAAAIKVTEKGATLASGDGTLVWTATDAQGAYQQPGCEDFSSQSFVGRVGSSLAANASWTSSGSTTPCLDSNRLYCFQVAATAPTPTPAATATPTPMPTATRTPNPDPPLACIANSPQQGMVYCYPTEDVAFDLYTDLLAKASSVGVPGIDDGTRVHVVAVGGNGGNGKSKNLCNAGNGGGGGYATTTTRVRDIARFKGTTVQWLAGDSGRHIDHGGTGGASSIVWMAPSSGTPPADRNILVLAGGGGGGGGCNLFSIGHDGGHGGNVNGRGTAENGNYDNYTWTTNVSMIVGPGEDGHGDGGAPGSGSEPAVGGVDWDGNAGGPRDAGDGFGGRGGRTNDSGPPEDDGGGWTLWEAGSVDGETVIGATGRGSDHFLGTSGGAGGGGLGGGGTGRDGNDIRNAGGGGGGGSVALPSTVSDVPLSRELVAHKVAFVFVK